MIPSNSWGIAGLSLRTLLELLVGVLATGSLTALIGGLVGLLLMVTVIVIGMMLTFARQTPTRRRDIIDVVRAIRGQDRRG